MFDRKVQMTNEDRNGIAAIVAAHIDADAQFSDAAMRHRLREYIADNQSLRAQVKMLKENGHRDITDWALLSDVKKRLVDLQTRRRGETPQEHFLRVTGEEKLSDCIPHTLLEQVRCEVRREIERETVNVASDPLPLLPTPGVKRKFFVIANHWNDFQEWLRPKDVAPNSMCHVMFPPDFKPEYLYHREADWELALTTADKRNATVLVLGDVTNQCARQQVRYAYSHGFRIQREEYTTPQR